ncbi:hypothetical protein PUMCH_001702 [Australozyma saopauloensis]|uniref:Uncharacterized protein n=1 Tax=Australozyma saopauloensis TaxID=291208 RepID=A0AAX4H7A2_9ASCO|nr:hypothetical protein PUMCH_001702 [[Candida] saopauloensis]
MMCGLRVLKIFRSERNLSKSIYPFTHFFLELLHWAKSYYFRLLFEDRHQTSFCSHINTRSAYICVMFRIFIYVEQYSRTDNVLLCALFLQVMYVHKIPFSASLSKITGAIIHESALKTSDLHTDVSDIKYVLSFTVSEKGLFKVKYNIEKQ